MELLSQLLIARPEGDATIQLLQGDLTAIPEDFAVDILAISAFRGDYRTSRKTLMNALFNAGISVADLAADKEIDLVSQLSCWLSRPLTDAQQRRFHIKKILCFEPVGAVEDVETEVGNLFRAINTFAMDENHNEIAMPILATGDRKFPIEAMLPALLDTALFWLENGLPLTSLKFVLHRTEQVAKALPIFENVSEQYALKQSVEAGHMSANRALTELNVLTKAAPAEFALPKLAYALQEVNQAQTRGLPPPSFSPSRSDEPHRPLRTPASAQEYDYFISYSHKHTAAVHEFVGALQARNPALRIFYDRNTIPPGGLWIKLISDAIQHSKNVVCILTPEYSESKVCWDEFQCAYFMESKGKSTIRTINFYEDENLPPMMAIRSYIDCTEGDLEKLKAAADELLQP